MAFDLSTAKPMSGGFDLSTAKPVDDTPTIGERIAGTPAARFAIGAATPIVGALQLGANLGDRLAKKLGLDPSLGPVLADNWNKLIAAKNKGFAYDSPESRLGVVPTDIMGAAGNLATGLMGPAGATTTSGMVAQGAGTGVALGAAQPGTTSLSQQGQGAALGGAVGAAAPVVAPYAAKVAGWVGDRFAGPTLAQIRAGQIARDAAGAKLPEIQQAVTQARPGITAAQGIEEAGINSPPMQALGNLAERNNSTLYSDLANRQAAERAAAIQNVTPDLETAKGARQVFSDMSYGKAFAADDARQAALADQVAHNNAFGGTGGSVPVERVSPELQALRGNPVIDAATAAAKARAPGAGDPMETLRGLHTMKVAIDAQLRNPLLPTSLQSMDKAALMDAKTQLTSAIEKQFPDYKAARTDYAAMSKPVDQANVLNNLGSILERPGGGERATPFLNALGRGEDAAIKGAGVNPAFGGLDTTLLPHQMDAVNNVANELSRDTNMSRSATLGTTDLTRILNQDTFSLRKMIPNWLSRGVSTATKGLDLAEAAISKKTTAALSDAMQSGQSLNDLFNVIPMSERNKILKAMVDKDPTLANQFARVAPVIGSVNALSSNKKQNALQGQ